MTSYRRVQEEEEESDELLYTVRSLVMVRESVASRKWLNCKFLSEKVSRFITNYSLG